MLVLSENATRVISSLGERPEYPDGAAVRVGPANDGSEQLAITPATTPAEADQVVEAAGARVFVDPAAAEILDDKVLDARINPEGRVEFLLALQ